MNHKGLMTIEKNDMIFNLKKTCFHLQRNPNTLLCVTALIKDNAGSEVTCICTLCSFEIYSSIEKESVKILNFRMSDFQQLHPLFSSLYSITTLCVTFLSELFNVICSSSRRSCSARHLTYLVVSSPGVKLHLSSFSCSYCSAPLRFCFCPSHPAKSCPPNF